MTEQELLIGWHSKRLKETYVFTDLYNSCNKQLKIDEKEMENHLYKASNLKLYENTKMYYFVMIYDILFE